MHARNIYLTCRHISILSFSFSWYVYTRDSITQNGSIFYVKLTDNLIKFPIILFYIIR